MRSEPPEDSGVRCLECGYNLTGLRAGRCPECGWRIDEELLAYAVSSAPPEGQRGLLAIFAAFMGLLIIGLTIYLAITGPVLQTDSIRPILLVALALVCGGLHITVSAYCGLVAGTWPIYAPWLVALCRWVGTFQVVGAIVFLWTQSPAAWNGPVEFLLWFAFTSAPGVTLLLVSAVALTNHRRNIRHLQRRMARDPIPAPVGAPFRVEASGRYPADKVHVVWDQTRRETNSTIEELIESTWRAKVRQAKDKHQTLYNGTLARLIGAATDGDTLALVIGPTDYRDFVGTNLYNAAGIARFGDPCFADPLGTSATVVTADGYLLYGRRNQRVLFNAGCLHPFGGMVELADQTADGSYDVFSAIRRELGEELNLNDGEISEVICTGLVRDHDIHQPELLFDAYVSVSGGELRSRFNADSDQEHAAIEACHDLPESIVPFVGRCRRITPITLAAMMLHGRVCWGVDWYENTAYVLFGDLPPRQPLTCG